MVMPVYSNTRCCARAPHDQMHVHRARSPTSCATTRALRDACRKKTMRRCDSACEFFALNTSMRTRSVRSTRAYRRAEHVVRRCRYIALTFDRYRAISMRLRRPTACVQLPQIACRSSGASGLRWSRSIAACVSATRIRVCRIDVDARRRPRIVTMPICVRARHRKARLAPRFSRWAIPGKPCSAPR
jgi:hypothetical protein